MKGSHSTKYLVVREGRVVCRVWDVEHCVMRRFIGVRCFSGRSVCVCLRSNVVSWMWCLLGCVLRFFFRFEMVTCIGGYLVAVGCLFLRLQ